MSGKFSYGPLSLPKLLGNVYRTRVTKFVVLSDSQGETGLISFACTGQGGESRC